MSSTVLYTLLSLACLCLPLCTASAQTPQPVQAQQTTVTDDAVLPSYAQYQARSPLMYRVSSNFGDQHFSSRKEHEPESNLIPESESMREGRHFSTLDACGNSICDQVIRQAHSLARIKLLREYIKDTVAMLDRLVTAVDSQIISAGSTLSRAVGGGCRAVQMVLQDVTKRSVDVDRGRSDALGTWYPVK